jgi:hypothetical protein
MRVDRSSRRGYTDPLNHPRQHEKEDELGRAACEMRDHGDQLT